MRTMKPEDFFMTESDRRNQDLRESSENEQALIRCRERYPLLENLEIACRAWARTHAAWKRRETTTGAVIKQEYGIRKTLEEIDAFDKRHGVPEAPAEKPQQGPAV